MRDGFLIHDNIYSWNSIVLGQLHPDKAGSGVQIGDGGSKPNKDDGCAC
jgi:hypothetical protein